MHTQDQCVGHSILKAEVNLHLLCSVQSDECLLHAHFCAVGNVHNFLIGWMLCFQHDSVAGCDVHPNIKNISMPKVSLYFINRWENVRPFLWKEKIT